MLGEQRREKIIELIRENGGIRVHNMSKLFHVSEPTIRQDLMKIEAEGEIARDHGGAYLKSTQINVRTLALHHKENLDLKQKIGEKAAEFVKSGSTLILDSGSTVTELAKNLPHKRDLRIITNSLNIALLLGAEPGMEVHMTGGEFKSPTLSLTGDYAAQFFENMHADQLFLAAAGITTDGLTFPGFSDLPVKRAMINSASKVFLLIDSSKINNPAFTTLPVLDRIDYLITDSGIKEEDNCSFAGMGIEVIIAP